jgi:hypothetical protein
MANTLDVTKLHVLIPTEYRSSLEIRIESDNDDPTARFTRLLGLNDDDVVSKQVKLSNIAKHFPTKETFVAALLVWKGIKTLYGPTTPKAFGPSVDAHIIHLGKLCLQHPWQRVMNYEIAFFQRYYTIETPDIAWSQRDRDFLEEYLLLPATSSSIQSDHARSPRPCNKFNEGKYCNQYKCKFSHACTFDRARCNGAHTAADCPLNPNRRPPPKERQQSGNGGYNNSGNGGYNYNNSGNGGYNRTYSSNNSNPNFTPVKDNNSRNFGGNRDRRQDRRD